MIQSPWPKMRRAKKAMLAYQSLNGEENERGDRLSDGILESDEVVEDCLAEHGGENLVARL